MNDNDFEKIKTKYIANMRPILKRRALFSDMTEEYVTPVEPNEYARVTIRFRAAKNNIDMVYLVCEKEKQLMQISSKDNLFDYYEIEIQLENKTVYYHFEIKAGRATCYYDKRGPVKEVENHYQFRLGPGFATPDWAKGAVMYQLYVDRFYNGDPNNDVQTGEYFYIDEPVRKIEDWDKYPDVKGTREFYGGDLQGVLDKLDYLEELGVQVIYFNPLFVSPSNHKYDIQDYDYIDPHFGKIVHDEGELLAEGQKENRFATKYIDRVTNHKNLEASNEFFIHVVEEIHKRGMKVILDGVFNHCGSFNKWMDRERIYEDAPGYEKGAYVSENSPYRHYFDFKAGSKWPYNANYDGWWGYSTLPKLNFEGSKELYQYILGVARKWVSPPFNIDGWRLDVAADLAHSPEVNHAFWRDFRRVVK
ncbi:MAG: alpha-glycosidase, partial [Clostridiales bacterium]|nr:alpha-glycosidase [Clostridiales bacterium]